MAVLVHAFYLLLKNGNEKKIDKRNVVIVRNFSIYRIRNLKKAFKVK